MKIYPDNHVFKRREIKPVLEMRKALAVFNRRLGEKFVMFCLIIGWHSANAQQVLTDAIDAEANKESQRLSEVHELANRWTTIDLTQPSPYFKLYSIQVSLKGYLGTSLDRSAEPLGLPDGLRVWSEWDRTCDIIRHQKSNHVSDKEILPYWHHFFGYVHGRTGISPPGTWQYFLMHECIDQDRPDFDGTVCPSDDPENGYEKEIDYQIDSETSARPGTIRPKTDGQNAPWTSVIMSIDPSNPAIGSSGPGYWTIWYELTVEKEMNYAVLWGASNGGIAYYIKFDIETGKQLDKCYLQLLDSIYLQKPKKKKK